MAAQPIPIDPETIPSVVEELRGYFSTGATRPIAWRQAQLSGLVKLLRDHLPDWIAAREADLGAHKYETTLLLENAVSDVRHTSKNLEAWLQPKKVTTPWALYPGTTNLVFEPYGVVCDFVPFNYPMYLVITTVVPILASGNCCLLKPSSNTPACARLLQDLVLRYLDPRAIRVVCGPTSICELILGCRFDFIFYTGSPAIAKGVQAAAARHLTPVLLELGGKSPCYVDKSLSLSKCCRRLVWGKFFNGGQTCVCPDYCLVHEAVWEPFKAEMVKVIGEFYGDIAQYNDNITHIINQRHFDRLVRAIESSGGNVLLQGLRDRDQLYIAPVLIESPRTDSQLMTDEIFGPVLPFLKVSGPDEAIEFINQREKPLALYVLTDSANVFTAFQRRTSSGALMQNDTVFHVSSPFAPFGGVGHSGMGQYHGKFGIRALSHLKPVVSHGTLIDLDLRYPPYTEGHLSVLKKFA